MNDRTQLYDFLDSYKHGVISTIHESGLPQSALIGFGQTRDNLLIFGTHTTSRKYKNLLLNPHVSFTIGGQTPETIQLEGSARELLDEELQIVKDFYWPKNPFAERGFAGPTGRYFIITPNWIRYTDIRTNPWTVTQL